MTTPQKHKDELLVENAILKYNEQVRLMLKEELAPFSKSIKELEKRVSEVETDVETIQQIVEPFSKIKNKIWFWLVTISLAVGIAGDQVTNWLQSIINSLK